MPNLTHFLRILISRSLNIFKDNIVLFLEIFNTIELIHFYEYDNTKQLISELTLRDGWLDVVQEKTEFTEYLGERPANFAFFLLLKNILPQEDTPIDTCFKTCRC